MTAPLSERRCDMSEFASYESEFTHACMDANSKISTLERLAPGSGRDAAVKEAQAAVDSAADVVSRLGMEAGPSDRGRVRECKSSLSELRSKLSVARSNNRAAELAREQLLASADAPARMEAEAQHARLLETTSRMQRGTDKLRAACQVAVETEAVGVSILGDLDQQRMTLEQTRERRRPPARLPHPRRDCRLTGSLSPATGCGRPTAGSSARRSCCSR